MIGVWQVILVVYVVKIVFGEAVVAYGLLHFSHTNAQLVVPILELLGLLIALPMATALWLYAFRPATVWR